MCISSPAHIVFHEVSEILLTAVAAGAAAAAASERQVSAVRSPHLPLQDEKQWQRRNGWWSIRWRIISGWTMERSDRKIHGEAAARDKKGICSKDRQRRGTGSQQVRMLLIHFLLTHSLAHRESFVTKNPFAFLALLAFLVSSFLSFARPDSHCLLPHQLPPVPAHPGSLHAATCSALLVAKHSLSFSAILCQNAPLLLLISCLCVCTTL